MFDLPPLTTALFGLSALALAIRFVTQKYPDLHPFALFHQSSISPVRNSDESAIHRSIITPFTYPLVSGLNIREGHSFRDGDLRDVWDLAKAGKIGTFDKESGQIKYYNHESDLTPKLHIAANQFNHFVANVKRIAICLPNCIENIVASFACAHYNIASVLLPLTNDSGILTACLKLTEPEILVCVAGALDFNTLTLPSSVKCIVLVDTAGDARMDWSSQLRTVLGGSILVHTWDQVVSSSSRLPSEKQSSVEDNFAETAVIVPYTRSNGEVLKAEFTHKNLVAAIAAQLRIIPHGHTWKTTDVVVPVEPLQGLYSRVLLFSALATGATVVLCGTTGHGFDIDAVKAVNPSILIISPKTLREITAYTPNLLVNLRIKRAEGILAFGTLPAPIIRGFSNLRILYTHEDQPPTLESLSCTSKDKSADSFTSEDLSLARALLGTHIIYALTHACTAGSLCQTHLLDYRNLGPIRVFGSVLPSLEAVVKDVEQLQAKDRRGSLFVRGPSVSARGWVSTDIVGEWGDDGCFREL
ncbi:hypothetical protein V1512DRAFT_240756 [Lipomyces arxii]|uniref:uncharacterized protein n=1 Tax=Lipomyces arxii TaxID=56418 RepID=UPI0034CE4620